MPFGRENDTGGEDEEAGRERDANSKAANGHDRSQARCLCRGSSGSRDDTDRTVGTWRPH
jgi:hypothetical protein